MRMSSYFGTTLRDAPSEADIVSHRLLLRAGYIRQLAAGVFSILPMGQRVVHKIEAIIRDEINRIGGQEITMPVVNPADIWKESKRWYAVDESLTRFQDRGGRDMVLAMTHEEVVSDLVRKEVNSYRQLPMLIFQIQTKWRDEPRPRAGLIRVREFSMKDSYSLDLDEDGLDQQYRAHYQAYFNVFHRCGLPVVSVGSDTGMMGGSLAHEFMYLTPIGEDTLLLCDECGYAANREVARFRKQIAESQTALETTRVATPNTKTIDELAKFLDIPISRTAKAIFLNATIAGEDGDEQQMVFTVVRGDMELNEIKLSNVIQAKVLRPATEEEIRAIGSVPGYASPIGIKNCLIVIDDAVAESSNLVAGANEEGFHLLNVNYGRDYQADIVADIVAARDGDACPDCGHPLRTVRGVEVGNIFKLGTRFSEALGATYLDKDGKAKPVVMGSYGIGVGRLLACIAEHAHDDKGLIWPVAVAPYQVHLVSLKGGEEAAEQLYQDLQGAGIEVLYDDRDERPGVKFNDADLIGAPLRLTVSKRSLKNGGIEYKRRDLDEQDMIAMTDVVASVQGELASLQTTIDQMVLEVEYKI